MKVFGFAGFSGAGKTTLIEQLLPLLVARGLRLASIKHAHHDVDIDQPGKDSYRHRQAGSSEVLLVSGRRWALVHELGDGPDAEPAPDFAAQLALLSPCDLVLVEGYKALPIPKLEVHRAANGKPLLAADDPHIVAIATDVPLDEVACRGLPQLALDDAAAIAAFIVAHLALPELP